MSSSLKRSVAACAAAVLTAAALLVPVAAVADETFRIEYLGGAEGMVVPDKDLFGNVSTMVPGDECVGIVTVCNSGREPVSLWFQAEEVGWREAEALLSQMELQITDTASGRVIYRGPLRMAEDIDPIALGTYDPGNSAELFWTISLPFRAGNSCQDAAASVTWTFAAEEDPGSSLDRLPPTGGLRPSESTGDGGDTMGIGLPEGGFAALKDIRAPTLLGDILPQTGDVVPTVALGGALLVSMGALVAASRRRRRGESSCLLG